MQWLLSIPTVYVLLLCVCVCVCLCKTTQSVYSTYISVPDVAVCITVRVFFLHNDADESLKFVCNLKKKREEKKKKRKSETSKQASKSKKIISSYAGKIVLSLRALLCTDFRFFVSSFDRKILCHNRDGNCPVKSHNSMGHENKNEKSDPHRFQLLVLLHCETKNTPTLGRYFEWKIENSTKQLQNQLHYIAWARRNSSPYYMCLCIYIQLSRAMSIPTKLKLE